MMDKQSVRALLDRVRSGEIGVAEAEERLAALPFSESEGALIDTHRALRQRIPEVVFARGKTASQVASALTTLAEHHGRALATRVSRGMSRRLEESFEGGAYDPVSRLFMVGDAMAPEGEAGPVAVITAGTSDLRVASEAAETLKFFGRPVIEIHDVGVAGLHRLLSKVELLRSASAVIVAAGMDAALAGVVGGIVAAPVIAVPTSVGYGASFGGLAALLAMLNSCAAGVTVVNIDNGFGAAAAAMRFQSE